MSKQVEQVPTTMRDRFVNRNISELRSANKSPILGYEQEIISTLEKAVEPLISAVPDIMDYVNTAKQECNRNSNLLTEEESAAIYLYTMPTLFFERLNEKLRAENRMVLKPWFAYLKLFLTALEKLPSAQGSLWRGVRGDVATNYNNNQVKVWWSVNSCSTDHSILQAYVGNGGTVFQIQAINGKSISDFSAFPLEQEVILMPGTHLRINGCKSTFMERLFLISLMQEQDESKMKTQRLVHI